MCGGGNQTRGGNAETSGLVGWGRNRYSPEIRILNDIFY